MFFVKSQGTFLKDVSFEFGVAVILYDIYFEGKIERQSCDNPKKVTYYYHEANGKKHAIGKAKVHPTKRYA